MITKRPTIEDIYNHDYFMAAPGVRDGLMERAKSGDPEFSTEMTDDGDVVYYNAPHGESVPIGRSQFQPPQQQEGDILLAEVGSRGLPERAYTGVNPDSMKQIDPTIRQRVADFMQAGFEGMGVDRATARKNAQTLMGGQSSGLPLGMGIADIIPFLGTGLQTEEAIIGGQNAVENASQGNYGAAAAEGVGSAMGMIPGVSSTIKAGKALAPKAAQVILDVTEKTGMPVKGLGIVEKTKENSQWIPRNEFTSYMNQPKQLQGFKKDGPNKGFGEEKYKHAEFVEVKFEDGTTHIDAIRGLNKPHALSRAFGNWPDATEIKPLARSEVKNIDVDLVKEVDAIMGASKEKN